METHTYHSVYFNSRGPEFESRRGKNIFSFSTFLQLLCNWFLSENFEFIIGKQNNCRQTFSLKYNNARLNKRFFFNFEFISIREVPSSNPGGGKTFFQFQLSCNFYVIDFIRNFWINYWKKQNYCRQTFSLKYNNARRDKKNFFFNFEIFVTFMKSILYVFFELIIGKKQNNSRQTF